ncbi:MAG TPA: sugar ABC transporter ATP-binding protein [Streptosporangiaceae bacterium]|jgi:ribose transport system ATP-binding protein|nr:sugar ABC transporter ATP-binding protein [Streptosporangiaceae bacterium]
MPPALEIRGLSKTFGVKTVLDSFELTVQPGEIHVLLGQNGSGKSTLIKILSGYHDPDPGGLVRVGGGELHFGSPASSRALGCRFVHQDLGLVETSSVLDNLLIGPGFPTSAGTIRRRSARKLARDALAAVGLDIDPAKPVAALGSAERTGVAIARAMFRPAAGHLSGQESRGETKPAALILDEPTAALPVNEVERLLANLRATAATGVGILYVTHHLDEVTGFADRVSVLRNGVLIDTWRVPELDRDRLIHQLIGAELEQVQRIETPRADTRAQPPVVSASDLWAGPVEGLTLDAWAGEVTGICGLTGSGRESILGALFGARPRAGEVRIAGKPLKPHRTDLAILAGVAYLPSDRRASGAVMDLTARENLTLVNLKPFWRHLLLRKKLEKAEVARWFEKFDVRPKDGISDPLNTFSGGNQQKLLFAKWLREIPKVLLLDEPTQGVDVGAKAELHRQIVAAARLGAAVIVSSTDLDELVTLCSRVLVIRNGQIFEEITGGNLTTSTLNRSFHLEPAGAGNNGDHSAS